MYDQKYATWVPFYTFMQFAVTIFIYVHFEGQREVKQIPFQKLLELLESIDGLSL